MEENREKDSSWESRERFLYLEKGDRVVPGGRFVGGGAVGSRLNA